MSPETSIGEGPDCPVSVSPLSAAAALCGLLLTLAGLTGCDTADPPQFRPNLMEMVRFEVPPAQQKQIATALEALFGTPDEPYVFPETGLDLVKLRVAAGGVWSDQSGEKFGLYRRHCAHCHGITGDGYGPTAVFLNPYPRDYRRGLFKFKSTERASPPTSADLGRVLEHGIPGTAMPSFRLLPREEREALVEYVKYLSMRGQMEIMLIREAVDMGPEEPLPTDREFLIDGLLTEVAEPWSTAGESVIQPEVDGAPSFAGQRSPQEVAESVAKGRDLFYGKTANCFTCHGETALGDGQVDYDDWNKPVKQFLDEHEGVDAEALGLLPPRPIRPRNLRQGVLRGGRRPVDLYWRLQAGINGTPMPAVPRGEGGLSPEQMWQLIDYVLQLPYETASSPPKITAAPARERL